MSAAKHTPGPWEIGTPNGFNANHVYASGDKGVALVYGISMYTTKQEAEESLMCAEGMANARLIAAAPDLLAALQDLADDISERYDLDSPSTNPGIKNTVAAARAAIAKATGAAK